MATRRLMCRHEELTRSYSGRRRGPRRGSMRSRRIITPAIACIAATLAASPAAAPASPLLSGYGGPGQGSQVILGSSLVNGSAEGGGGGSQGGGGSTGAGESSSAAAAGRLGTASGSGEAPAGAGWRSGSLTARVRRREAREARAGVKRWLAGYPAAPVRTRRCGRPRKVRRRSGSQEVTSCTCSSPWARWL